jgi:hypothetical protein
MRTFLLVAVLVGLPVQAHAQFRYGNELAADMHAWEKAEAAETLTSAEWHQAGEYSGYVLGAADAYEGAGVFCGYGKVATEQLEVVVAAYLKSDPTRWHFSANSLVGMALREAFPCG